MFPQIWYRFLKCIIKLMDKLKGLYIYDVNFEEEVG